MKKIKQDSHWIKMGEKNPKRGQKVLMMDNTNQFHVGEHKGKGVYLGLTPSPEYISSGPIITRWMAIPDPEE